MVLQFAFHIILILCSLHALASAQQDRGIAQLGCDSSCGDVGIPYPFGMNDPKCYAGMWFEIECRNTSDQGQTPYLKSIDVEVRYIDVINGTIGIMNPIYHWNCGEEHKDGQQVVDLRGSPFVYSEEKNRFVGVGCNKIAFLMSNDTQVSGCVSICDDNRRSGCTLNVSSTNCPRPTSVVHMELAADRCNGKSCCETSLPLYLSEYNVTTQNLSNSQVSDQCNYALIVAVKDYASQNIKFPDYFRDSKYAIAVFEWEILRNSSVKLPAANCKTTNVTSSQYDHSGWRCYCHSGFGNPYVDRGCIMMRGERKSQAKWAIGVFSSLGSIILLLGSWWLYEVVRKRIIEKKLKEKYFKQNGGLLLKQRLSSGEVNVEKVKHFSLKDLEKATDRFNMNTILGKGGQGTVYKGMLADGKIVAVKKFKVQGKVEEFINEFVVLSQVNHRNVVKLLGCCLETEIPLLVYEFIPNGNLFEYLHEHNEDLPMTWDMRLRIATEVAGALFYLHSAASQPIYHRDIKSTNILLDEKYRAKVADFGSSRMISIEDTHLTTAVQGTFGYLDPEYFHTSQFTEKSDVYSFGVVLVELLTGQKPISSSRPEEAKSLGPYFVLCMEQNRLFDIIDERVAKEGEKEHIIVVANLAYRCLELNGNKRPNMKEVTNELDGIWKLERKFNAQQNHEEIELAAIEDYQSWAAYSASDTGPTPSNRTPTVEVMPILIK